RRSVLRAVLRLASAASCRLAIVPAAVGPQPRCGEKWARTTTLVGLSMLSAPSFRGVGGIEGDRLWVGGRDGLGGGSRVGVRGEVLDGRCDRVAEPMRRRRD